MVLHSVFHEYPEAISLSSSIKFFFNSLVQRLEFFILSSTLFELKKKKEPLLADYLSILHSSIEPEIDILQCSSHRDRSIHTITMISIVKVQRQWAVAVVIAKWLSKRLVIERLWVLGYFSSTFNPLINVSFRRSLVILQHLSNKNLCVTV